MFTEELQRQTELHPTFEPPFLYIAQRQRHGRIKLRLTNIRLAQRNEKLVIINETFVNEMKNMNKFYFFNC